MGHLCVVKFWLCQNLSAFLFLTGWTDLLKEYLVFVCPVLRLFLHALKETTRTIKVYILGLRFFRILKNFSDPYI